MSQNSAQEEEDDFDDTVTDMDEEKPSAPQKPVENAFDAPFKGLDIDLNENNSASEKEQQKSPDHNTNTSATSAAQQSFSAMFESKGQDSFDW